MGLHYGNDGIIHWSVENCRFDRGTLVTRLVKRTQIYILRVTLCSYTHVVYTYIYVYTSIKHEGSCANTQRLVCAEHEAETMSLTTLLMSAVAAHYSYA